MPEQNRVQMRGGRAGFIGRRARLARHHGARRVMMAREPCSCHVTVLSSTPAPHQILGFRARTLFWPNFLGQFWRSSGARNGSCSISSESSRRILSNGIKFSRIGVRMRELWLPKVGVPELFLCVFPAKIPVKRGMPPANRELHAIAGVVIFPTHPGSRVNLQRVGKTLCAKAAVRKKNASNLRAIFPRFLSAFARVFDLAPDFGFRHSWYRRKACAAFFFKVLGSREIELGLVRYSSANMGRRSVFGPLEDIFPIGIPARPGKILTIREFHVVHVRVLFLTCLGLQINLLWVRKTLCASVATSRGKFRNFQHSLISSACFRVRGRRSSRYRISMILVSSESLCYLLFKGTGLAQGRA